MVPNMLNLNPSLYHLRSSEHRPVEGNPNICETPSTVFASLAEKATAAQVEPEAACNSCGLCGPIGSLVVPYGGSYLGSYKVNPKRNYNGAYGECLSLLIGMLSSRRPYANSEFHETALSYLEHLTPTLNPKLLMKS